MHWVALAWRLGLTVAAGLLLGWLIGHLYLGLILALAALALLWSYEIARLQRWLAEPGARPPGGHGLWGEIVSTIYRRQRQSAEARERLQSTVDYLLESFASMREGVVLVESGGGIRWCNQAAVDMLGLRYPEDAGQAITNLVRSPEFIQYLQAGRFEEPLQFTGGADRRRHLQLIVTRFAEGDRLLIVRDVSELVRTEQIRRDFVGNVSHELRTPLTVITGYLGNFLMDRDSLPETWARAFQQMSQQARRMENLLKDLLWLSRIEAEERAGKTESVDLAALLEELRDEIAHGWPDRSLQLQLDTRRPVQGDYRELYSCVSNLVANAMKYSDGDSPVSVHLREQGGELRLSVRDRGIGIDARHIPRLTERFYRVDDSRSSATGGTGLGLAIVKHVVASHGARLEIDSELGEGSCFTLVFPAGERADGIQSERAA